MQWAGIGRDGFAGPLRGRQQIRCLTLVPVQARESRERESSWFERGIAPAT